MKCIMSAIAYLHSLNIIHIDLKFENIIFKYFNDLSSVKLLILVLILV